MPSASRSRQLALVLLAICPVLWACSDDPAEGSGTSDTTSADVGGDGAPEADVNNDAGTTADAGVADTGGGQDVAEGIDTGIAPTDSAGSDTGAGDTNADGGATDIATTDAATIADIAQPATCTQGQWAACDDGDPCTSDHCHPNGCHHFDKADCDSCPLFSRVYPSPSGAAALASSALTPTAVVALGSEGPGANQKPFLIARSHDGALQWTLNYQSSGFMQLRGIAVRDDGFFWLVGVKSVAGQQDGVVVRLKDDGKASVEWAVQNDKQDTSLADVLTLPGNAMIAVGARTNAQKVPTGLVIWRDAEGKLTGPQSADASSGTQLVDVETDPGGGHWAVGWHDGQAKGVIVHIAAGGALTESMIGPGKPPLQLRRGTALQAGKLAALGDDGKPVLAVGGKSGWTLLKPQVNGVGLGGELTATSDGDVVIAGALGSSGTLMARVSVQTGKALWQAKLTGAPTTVGRLLRRPGGYHLAGQFPAIGAWMARTDGKGGLDCKTGP